ncbi:unnamed protein product [Calypogeia fissa]
MGPSHKRLNFDASPSYRCYGPTVSGLRAFARLSSWNGRFGSPDIKRNLLFGPEPEDFWKPPPKGFRSCPDPTSPLPSDGEIPTEGYLQVFLEGGLNQQRMGICDAVAVAKILNVTLVLPHFDVNSVWQDTSKFEDVFDVEQFLRSLENDVHIVTELPSEFALSKDCLKFLALTGKLKNSKGLLTMLFGSDGGSNTSNSTQNAYMEGG